MDLNALKKLIKTKPRNKVCAANSPQPITGAWSKDSETPSGQSSKQERILAASHSFDFQHSKQLRQFRSYSSALPRNSPHLITGAWSKVSETPSGQCSKQEKILAASQPFDFQNQRHSLPQTLFGRKLSGQYLQVIPEFEEIKCKPTEQAKNPDELVNVQVPSKYEKRGNSTLLQVVTSEALYKRRNAICEQLEIFSGLDENNLYRYRANMIVMHTLGYECAIM